MGLVELVAGILAGFAALVSAILGWTKFFSARKEVDDANNAKNLAEQERHQAESEMRFQRAALEFPDFIEEWSHISEDVVRLIEETCIDRFIILRAWNGHLEPRWTTAVYQIREVGQKPVSYVHFELDIDYVQRLREISITNSMMFNVDDIPDSAIKEVYRAEGVKSAIWAHLHSATTPEGASSHTYCSFATHNEGGIDEATQTMCKIITGRLKGIALSFDNKIS